jgi:gamma-glutamyltranspeptidase / glutathione hydrolase
MPRLVAILLALAGSALAASLPPVEGRRQMVVTEQRLASEVGERILDQGGNAIDAAVAAAYALAVVHPCCGNLGGGGFLTIRLADGRTVFIDARERAPLAATRDMYLDAEGNPVRDRSTRGWLAVAVPGTARGLEHALARYGTMKRERVIAPAIELAEKGFVLGPADVAILRTGTEAFRAQPNVAAIFLDDGEPYEPGDRLVQRDLARTLRLLAERGAAAMYGGPIGEAIVAASGGGGGILAAEDFTAYAVKERPPVTCEYRGQRVVTAPPPSSGGVTLCEILNVLAGYDLARLGFHSAEGVHYAAEAMRHAFRDRNTLLGDPDFVDNPVERLLSAARAEAIRAAIEPGRATPSSALPGPPPAREGESTTHLSVVDRHGNAVAFTTTINAYFGARVVAGDTGFFLNDEMDDFAVKPGTPNLFGLVQGEANAVAPGKRPLSSMAPTIVVHDDAPFLVLGSPGGPRIITAVLEGILNVVDHGMDVQQAVDAPRIHHQWLPDVLVVEPFALSPDTRRLLEGMGYKIVELRPWGALESIMVAPRGWRPRDVPAGPGGDVALGVAESGRVFGANDPRRPAGAAIGK